MKNLLKHPSYKPMKRSVCLVHFYIMTIIQLDRLLTTNLYAANNLSAKMKIIYNLKSIID